MRRYTSIAEPTIGLSMRFLTSVGEVGARYKSMGEMAWRCSAKLIWKKEKNYSGRQALGPTHCTYHEHHMNMNTTSAKKKTEQKHDQGNQEEHSHEHHMSPPAEKKASKKPPRMVEKMWRMMGSLGGGMLSIVKWRRRRDETSCKGKEACTL